jgi:hypothetical protein
MEGTKHLDRGYRGNLARENPEAPSGNENWDDLEEDRWQVARVLEDMF